MTIEMIDYPQDPDPPILQFYIYILDRSKGNCRQSSATYVGMGQEDTKAYILNDWPTKFYI